MASLEVIGIVLLILGLVLTGVEISIPGLGIFGILGIASLGLSVLLLAHTFTQGILLVLLIIAILAILFFVVVRMFGNGRIRRPIVMDEDLEKEEASALLDLIGREGSALCDMHPAGKGLFDGESLDVVSEGKFIPQGAKVRIIQIRNGHPIVRQI